MGDKQDNEFLKKLIDSNRANLQNAVKSATASPRPANACTSHDNLFALAKATAESNDVILLLLEKNIGSSGVLVWVKTLMWPVSVAVSFIAFSPQAPAIAEAVTRALVK